MKLAKSKSVAYDRKMPVKRSKNGRGGVRPGAGRKAVLANPVSITVDLEKGDADALKASATDEGVSVASLVRKAVTAYLKRRRKS
jgi:hypothetical protein